MPKVKQKNPSQSTRKIRPPLSDEARENQAISLAYDLVMERLMNGTATSQETTHFLKLGSTKERIEREILEKQKELIEAKTEALKSAARIEELYSNALDAMRSYNGYEDSHEDPDVQ